MPRAQLAAAVGDRDLAGTWASEALRVAAWRPRLALRPGAVGSQAARTDGTVLPRLYRSRHDAAEALYEGLVEPVEPREPGDALSA